MTDSRFSEGLSAPDDLSSVSPADRSLSSVLRPALEMLEAKGGLHFAVLCLCLMSLAVGLLFHRSLHSAILLPSSFEAFVHETGPEALADLDELIVQLTAQNPRASVQVVDLRSADEMASRIAQLIDDATSIMSSDDKTEAPAKTASRALAQVKRFRELLGEITPQASEGAVPSDQHHQLGAELREMRLAYGSFLQELSRKGDRVGQRLSNGLAVLAVSVWAILLIGTLVGIVFLRIIRDEVALRFAAERAIGKADYLAHFDPETGLGTRLQFQVKLSDRIATRQPLTVLLLDIDGFREFNDRYGRLSGDVVVKEIAYRVRKQAQEHHGFAARLSGDDFAILLPEENATGIVEFARDMSDLCRNPIARAGQTFSVTVSIGAAPLGAIGAEEYPTHERLMRMAEFALEMAREKGAAGIEICNGELENRFVNRKKMTEGLPRAIEGRELQVFFQPQTNLLTSRIFGFEALVRWTSDGAQSSAGDLIRAAEQAGLIADLDQYMLEESVKLLADWNKRHRTDFTLSVNISALHLPESGMIGFVSSCLERYCFSPGLLTLEITESAELDGKGHAAQMINGLRALGCRVSIDDFGTGYSSLSYLKKICVDEVKIDRSFLSGIEDSQTARDYLKSVLRLPDCLGQSVIVEGVETLSQESIVKALGAKRIQGYLHGRPRPALEWLAEATYSRCNAPGGSSTSCGPATLTA